MIKKSFKHVFYSVLFLSMALGIGTSTYTRGNFFKAEAATVYNATIDKATSGTGTGVTTAFTDGAILPIGTGNGNISVVNDGPASFVTKYYRNSASTHTILNNAAGEIRLYPYNTNGGELRYEISSGFTFTSITATFSGTTGAASINGGTSSTDRTVTATFSSQTSLVSLKNSANTTSSNNLQIISVSFTYEGEATGVAVDSVDLSPSSLSLVAGGSTSTLTVTITPSNATDQTVTFQSSNSLVASVSASGVVTPLKQGTATITVTTNSGNKQDTTSVSVDYATLSSISLNKTSSSLILGETELFTVTASPTTASNLVTWASSNEAVATVSNGTVTTVSVGNASITATSTQDVTKTATVDITVLPVPVWSRFTKITSSSQLYFGATYIIADSTGAVAMSKTASGNNIPQTTVTLESGNIVDSNSIMKVTLGIGKTADSYSLKSVSSDSSYNGLYLYAASSSSNYLRLKDTLDANGSWKITFTAGVPLLEAQGSFTRETMQYNSGSSIFSAYDTASQGAVALYLDEGSVDHTVSATLFADEVNTGLGSAAVGTCASVKTILDSAYNRLSTEAKNIYDTSSDVAFVNARARMAYLAAYVSSTPSPIFDNIDGLGKGDNSIIMIVIIAALGLTSVLAYSLGKKKEEQA